MRCDVAVAAGVGGEIWKVFWPQVWQYSTFGARALFVATTQPQKPKANAPPSTTNSCPVI